MVSEAIQKKSIAVKAASECIVDAQTLDLLKNRDGAFLEKLFREVNPYLTRVCLSNGLFADDVNELIHQTWEKFFSNLEKFEGRSQIRTFICGILFNKIREHRRLQKRFAPEEDVQKIMDESFTEEGWWKLPPTDPQKLVELRQTSEFIRECMDGLSEQQMRAFVMKEVEEESSDDVCNVLGITGSHLRVLLFRAKDKLRKCLEGKVSIERN